MRYGTITDAPGPDVIRRAVEVFGPGGCGLSVTERGMLNVRLSNAIGHVAVETSRTPDRRTEVTLETREYDAEVQAFIGQLPRYSPLGRLIRRWRKR